MYVPIQGRGWKVKALDLNCCPAPFQCHPQSKCKHVKSCTGCCSQLVHTFSTFVCEKVLRKDELHISGHIDEPVCMLLRAN